MKSILTRLWARATGMLAVSLMSTLAASAAPAPTGVQTVTVIQTNWTTRVITNVIEVSAPQNVFVTEYRTNWATRTVTNVVEVVLTNWATRTLTNTTALTFFRTNLVDRYITNWTAVSLTNWNTLTLTNWETVVVTKTNWIRQPMVNVVEVNVPVSDPPVLAVPAVAAAPAPVISLSEPAPASGGPARDTLVVDVERLTSTAADNQRELKFSVRLANDTAAPLRIEQWRVERDDAAVLFFAQTQEFKRALPPGRYSIQVTARREVDSPVLTARRNLQITGDSVVQR